MQALIENLVKLQTIELDRARLNHELRALPAEIAQAEAALAAAERQSAEVSAALNREESLRTRLEREIDAHRQKTARFRTQLDSVTTPEQAAAMEHEIQFESAEGDRLENEEYASLERTETQEAALAQSRAKVELLAAELEGVRTRVAARQQELAAELRVSTPDAKPCARLSIRTGWRALTASPPPAVAPALPALRISSAPAAAWVCARKSGTSSARASCLPATVATASSTGTRPCLPHRKRRSPKPFPAPAALSANPARLALKPPSPCYPFLEEPSPRPAAGTD